MLKKAFIFMLAVLMVASVASATEIDGVNLPDTMLRGNHLLVLNGGGTRVAFFNNVYVGGLWLERAMTDPEAIINADEPMVIRIHVLSAFFASSKHIRHALHNGFRSQMPKGDITPIKEETERFDACFEVKIKEHDEFDVVYIPKKGTSVYFNGELRDTIPGYEFKKAVFGIWIGKKATVNKSLSAGMVAGNVSQEALSAQKEWAAKLAAKAEKKVASAEQAKATVVATAEQQKAESMKAEAMKAQEEAAAKAEAMKAQEKAKAEAEAAAMKAQKEAQAKAAAAAKKAEAAAMEAKAAAMKAQEEAQARAAAAAKAKAAAKARMATEMAKLTPAEAFTKLDIYFGSNSSKLSATARQRLNQKVAWMKANPGLSIAIDVFCDERGSKAYNYRLAGRRAQSVKNFLLGSGIDESRIETFIVGADTSADAGHGPAAWAKNRRAHFRIK